MKVITGKLFKEMVLCGANTLHNNYPEIDALNVFPVPDGDTGTNMSLTFLAGAKEVENLDSNNIGEISKKLSKGLLMGARGNSGVILSQIFRGISMTLQGHEEADALLFAQALENGAKVAYKAVMRPVEGTILTVIREASEAVVKYTKADMNIEDMFSYFVKKAENSLERTPELLPVLKEVGVVDSGGAGLLLVLTGFMAAIAGEKVDYVEIKSSVASMEAVSEIENGEEGYGYCTEFIIMTDKAFTEADEMEFKSYLESIGDSIVCVADEDIVKIHVHTNHPGLAFEKGLTYGQLSRMKVDNMREEHQEKLIRDAEKVAAEQAKKAPRKPVGFIAVSIGEGMNEIFRELGVDYLIEGGQTMNPSTEDMLTAIDAVNADHIFILPNNKNIVLAANQAKDLTKDKDIIVIPTKTVPQGITAIINYMPEEDVDTNMETMLEEIKNVKTGQVTYAVRDTHIDDKEIHEGDIMGIGDAGILSVGQSVEQTTKEMLSQLVDDDTELISLYYGQDVLEEDAERFAGEIEEIYPDVDVDFHCGGQPIYYYVLSVE